MINHRSVHNRIAVTAAAVSIALMGAACKKPEAPAQPSLSPAPSPLGVDESPLRLQPRLDDIPATSIGVEVAYVEGKAEASRNGKRLPLSPGDRLEPGDLVETGPSSACEIVIGNAATARLEENSALAINSFFFDAARRRSDLSLRKGSILAKAGKLLNPDAFVLRGPSMVCGVRGTRFAMLAEETGYTLLAVEEGTVKALPASGILDGLADAAKSNGVARAALEIAISLGPEVGPGMELSFGAKEIAAAEKSYAGLAAIVSSSPTEPIAEGDELPGAIPAARIVASVSANAIISAAPSLPRARIGKPLPASDKAKTILAGFGRMDAERPGKGAKPTAKPLDPSILGAIDSGGKNAVGDIVQFKGLAIVSDASGALRAYDDSGKLAWLARTGNSGSRHSYPIVFKDRIYYSGESSFDIIDGKSGAVILSKNAPEGDSRRDGLRPYQFPGGILAPREHGIDVISPETGETLDAIDVPEGLMMSPAALKSKNIVYVTSSGLFRLVQGSDKKVLKEIQTQARGISQQSLRNRGTLYFFADGTGMAVLIDVEADEPVWQRRVNGALTAEAEMGRSAVYLPTEDGLAVLGISDGETVATLPGISGPPLLSNDMLFLCTESGELIVARADPFTEIRRINLPFVGSARPLIVGKTLWVAGRGGKMVRIDPELLKREPRAGS